MTVIRCGNPECPEAKRGGQIIGEASEGSTVRIQCRKCRQFTTARV